MGSGGKATHFIKLGTRKRSQPHTPAALPPRKEASVRTEWGTVLYEDLNRNVPKQSWKRHGTVWRHQLRVSRFSVTLEINRNYI